MLKYFYPYEYAEDVFSIDYQGLYDMGFKAVIFDIDNTLVHHGDDSTPEIDRLFGQIHATGLKTLLLTDNTEDRTLSFMKNIDSLYICNANKPDPSCYKKALKMLGVKRNEAVVVGDQIFKDIVGANLSGIPSILVKFIRLENETYFGKRRTVEAFILKLYAKSRYRGRIMAPKKKRSKLYMLWKREILFCELSPFCYAISEQKEILKRDIQDIIGKRKFAHKLGGRKLPNTVYEISSGLIKRGPGIDPELQMNKAVNIRLASKKMNGLIIRPGEEFSFWRLVGKTTKSRGFKEGRVIDKHSLRPGLGGGLCNLANTIHRLILHSPLDVTEFHQHSDALAPDEGKRVPLSSGTSVCYNYIDFRFKNNTDQTFQLFVRCKDNKLYAELRSARPLPWEYEITEEGHRFCREGEKYYRVSKIYRNTIEKSTGRLITKELILDNHSEVMYDYGLIPKEYIR